MIIVLDLFKLTRLSNLEAATVNQLRVLDLFKLTRLSN